ncbi:Flp family type IVb pilin [Pseudomonas sp. NY15181]|uniref:Flp family type IVb pilin n=1 Tax=Pseudomonas sp. NY15181 TaxID=3400349 RepID=UPI003A8A2D06
MNLNTKDLTLKLYCKAKAFVADKEGATAIEYAVIAGLIAVAIVAMARTLGTDIGGVFTKISGELPK